MLNRTIATHIQNTSSSHIHHTIGHRRIRVMLFSSCQHAFSILFCSHTFSMYDDGLLTNRANKTRVKWLAPICVCTPHTQTHTMVYNIELPCANVMDEIGILWHVLKDLDTDFRRARSRIRSATTCTTMTI